MPGWGIQRAAAMPAGALFNPNISSEMKIVNINEIANCAGIARKCPMAVSTRHAIPSAIWVTSRCRCERSDTAAGFMFQH
jgi:hypothetical protein